MRSMLIKTAVADIALALALAVALFGLARLI